MAGGCHRRFTAYRSGALADVENGVIDVFFCFMFDRIGRIASETPFIVQNIVKKGVEVWSANEGQRTFSSDFDVDFDGGRE